MRSSSRKANSIPIDPAFLEQARDRRGRRLQLVELDDEFLADLLTEIDALRERLRAKAGTAGKEGEKSS